MHNVHMSHSPQNSPTNKRAAGHGDWTRDFGIQTPNQDAATTERSGNGARRDRSYAARRESSHPGSTTLDTPD